MQLYLNGVYETGIELEAGTHTLQVVNGDSNVGDLRTITLKEKATVYIRLKDGAVYDSVTNKEEFPYASLVGNFTGLEFLRGEERYDIAAWDPADENGCMDYVGGIYKKTVNFKPLEQELTLADGGYKVAFNGTWDRSIGDGGNNIALTIPAKTSEITFFVDGINEKVYSSIGTGTYHVTQNSGEIEYPAFGMTVSLIGTARENDDTNWAVDAKGYEFVQISDTLFLYQKTFKAGSYEYKTSFNYEKWYEKTDNKKITVIKDDTPVVFLYDASDESLYDSVADSGVIAEKLGMQTAPAESSVTTNANGTTKFVTTVAEKETDSVQLVYANRNNPSEFKKIPLQKGIAGNGKFNGTFATSDIFFGDDAVDIIYYYEVNGNEVMDLSGETVMVDGPTTQTVDLKQSVKGDTAYWSGDLTVDTYGQYKYFFVVYYGTSVKIYCDDDGNYGSGMLTDISSLRTYDLTVYKKEFKTPDWMKNGVVYQIFPDRFYNGDTKNDDAQTTSRGAMDYEFITNWSTLPENPEQEKLNPDTYPENTFKGDGAYSTEIYGGDLKGIIDRMDYLKEVGVSVIYLNPVFSSISSHRYDTTDYNKIDPILGTMGDFEQLVKEAKKHGMHIVLDGVFNHVSDDSIYFDRYYKFVGQDGKVGAYLCNDELSSFP